MWGFSAAALTVVFAVYVVSLLATLLTVGSLSDRIGRRPVVAVGLLILAVSMLVFIFADSAGWLMAARVIQGLGVGAATGALAAGGIDLQPNTRIGPLVNSLAPSLGLALGAAGAGLLVQFAPFPTVLVYAIIATLAVVLAVCVLFLPDTSKPVGFASRREMLRGLIPSAAIPRAARAQFLLIVPPLGSAWALGGLYTSLGTSIVETVFDIDNRLVAGLAIATMFASGSVAAVAMQRVASVRTVVTGAVMLALGVAVVVCALLSSVVVVYFVGTAIAGFGWGSTFMGAMSVLGGLGRPNERAQIFAAMFVVCYLAFSVPAVVAGVVTDAFGLIPTAIGYNVAIAVFTLGSGTMFAMSRPQRRPVRLEEVTPAPADRI